MGAPSLSIIVPLYNEEARLAKAFAELDQFARQHPFSALEIIFVNDGSTDKTVELIKSFTTACSVRCISFSVNKGKGAAVRAGMLASAHDFGLMIDADMSTPIAEINKFLPLMIEGRPVVIGSRKAASANVLQPQALYRQRLGDVYAMIARMLTGVLVRDFSCGFKCFSRAAIQKIFSRAKIDRWSADVEILSLAHREGLSITEVGVTWTNDVRTHVHVWRDMLPALTDLFRIRFMK